MKLFKAVLIAITMTLTACAVDTTPLKANMTPDQFKDEYNSIVSNPDATIKSTFSTPNTGLAFNITPALEIRYGVSPNGKLSRLVLVSQIDNPMFYHADVAAAATMAMIQTVDKSMIPEQVGKLAPHGVRTAMLTSNPFHMFRFSSAQNDYEFYWLEPTGEMQITITAKK